MLDEAFEEALDTFTAGRNDHGLAFAWHVRAWRYWAPMQAGDTIVAIENERRFARRAGLRFHELAALSWLARAHAWGPTPATQALADLDVIGSDGGGDAPTLAIVNAARALQLAMLGRHEDARQTFEDAMRMLAELGMTYTVAEWAQAGRFIAEWADDVPTAIARLEDSCAVLQRLGERSYYPTSAAMLARMTLVSGDVAGAERGSSGPLAPWATDDLASKLEILGVGALIAMKHGDLATAEKLAAEAIGSAGGTDIWTVKPMAMLDLATVRAAAGRLDEAVEVLLQARALFLKKENVAAAAQIDRRLALLAKGRDDEAL